MDDDLKSSLEKDYQNKQDSFISNAVCRLQVTLNDNFFRPQYRREIIKKSIELLYTSLEVQDEIEKEAEKLRLQLRNKRCSDLK